MIVTTTSDFRYGTTVSINTTTKVRMKEKLFQSCNRHLSSLYGIFSVYVAHDQAACGKTILKGFSFEQALCFRNQRKGEEPHKLSLKCESYDNGEQQELGQQQE